MKIVGPSKISMLVDGEWKELGTAEFVGCIEEENVIVASKCWDRMAIAVLIIMALLVVGLPIAVILTH